MHEYYVHIQRNEYYQVLVEVENHDDLEIIEASANLIEELGLEGYANNYSLIKTTQIVPLDYQEENND